MRELFRSHVALPADHGSWALYLGPLAIGIAAGGRWQTTTFYLIVATACGFLVRQPMTLAVKAHAGRRPRDILPAARFWIGIYAAVGLLHVTGLALRGFGYVLYLAIPGVLVFTWYLWLVSRRSERRQPFMEVLAAGVMALIAPAALWAALGRPDPQGWLLWLLVWLQSGTAILYAHLRLEQRPWRERRDLGQRLRAGAPALAMSLVGIVVAVVVDLALTVPYLVMGAEVLRGTCIPASGLKPKTIGYQLLTLSILFTLLFIVSY